MMGAGSQSPFSARGAPVPPERIPGSAVALIAAAAVLLLAPTALGAVAISISPAGKSVTKGTTLTLTGALKGVKPVKGQVIQLDQDVAPIDGKYKKVKTTKTD